MSLRWSLIGLGLAVLLVAGCTDHSSNAPPGSSIGMPATATAVDPSQTMGLPATALPASSPQPNKTPGSVSAPATAPPPAEVSIAAFSDSESIAFEYLQELVNEVGARESATSQELQAAQFLVQEFQAMGYRSEIQPFDVERVSSETSSLTVATAGGSSTTGPEFQDPPPVNPLDGSAVGRGEGPLVHLGLAMAKDLPEGFDNSIKGKIALIKRGTITFQEKVSRVSQAGALAAVIYNNLPGNFQGTMRQDSSIPAVSISNEDGAELLELLDQGPVQAALSVERAILPSRNVVAERPNAREEGDEVVILGGHYDTVAGIAGANDNSSGTAVLLTLATQLAELRLPFEIRFIAFGSEELGLLGSQAYLDSLSDAEKSKIVAMLNFDALGSGEQVTILGSESLTGLALRIAEDLGIGVIRRAGLRGGASDHANFARLGIPVLMFTSADFSRIHTPNDTLEFVEPRLLGDSARLALALLQSADFPR